MITLKENTLDLDTYFSLRASVGWKLLTNTQAEKTLNFYLNDKNLPKDLIPYWDFDAPEIPNEPRDVSTAACIASALYEMDGYCPGKNYKELADKILKNLSGPDYKAKVGENGNFILMHSVGSIPHGAEIDVPLNYADYYYEEALIRKRNIENNQTKIRR